MTGEFMPRRTRPEWNRPRFVYEFDCVLCGEHVFSEVHPNHGPTCLTCQEIEPEIARRLFGRLDEL